MIELLVRGQAVDIAPNTKITLNFASNIFGDISKITPSNSFTINLPKTPKNKRIFGMAMNTSAPYRRWEAELYINGIAVVDTAYLVMLSVGDTYEVALYWGVVTALQNLKDSDKTLADINEVLQITYGGENWWENWEGQYGKDAEGKTNAGLLNASYSVGDIDLPNNSVARTQAALLPSVKVSWLWDNIVADNGLNIELPKSFRSTLNSLAIPFTTHRAAEEEVYSTYFTKVNHAKYQDIYNATFYAPAQSENSLYFDIGVTQKELVVDPIILNTKHKFDTFIYRAIEEHKATFNIQVTGSQEYHSTSRYGMMLHVVKNGAIYKTFSLGRGKEFDVKMLFDADLEEGDEIFFYITGHNALEDYFNIASVSMEVTRNEDRDQVMGGIINTRYNLPTIKQLDFIKAICEMYGLWATLINGVVYLVKYSDFYPNSIANNTKVLDWSHKLIGTGDYDAQNSTYTLLDYAQRNILQYKEDDTVKVDASGVLFVDNETLDKEKEMVTLPFAASDGNIIPHLEWKDDNHTAVEDVKVEPRIMGLNEMIGFDSPTKATLSFSDLTFSKLTSNYSIWQKIMRNPIVIEEKVQLSEIDIKMLDFRKPIYLQKYGAQFAIDKVQWSEGEPSAVTFVKLPPAKDVGVATPYKVTTGVAYGVGIGGGVDAVPSLSYLVSGAGEYFAKNATIRFNESAGANVQLAFKAWVSSSGRTISTDNPYIYDGSNGDLDIIALTEESVVIG